MHVRRAVVPILTPLPPRCRPYPHPHTSQRSVDRLPNNAIARPGGYFLECEFDKDEEGEVENEEEEEGGVADEEGLIVLLWCCG
jgi:hypothetical protein